MKSEPNVGNAVWIHAWSKVLRNKNYVFANKW